MRVSERIGKSLWASALLVALAGLVNAPMVATAQVVVPTSENAPGEKQAAGTASEWLLNAREAIDKKDWGRAEHYIQIADALYQQTAETTPLNYTPAMAMQELTALRGAGLDAAGVEMSLSGNEFSMPTSTPPVPAQADLTNAAKQALLKARQNLALGHLDVAQKMAISAGQFEVDWATIGDSPAMIKALIQQQTELAALAEARDPKYNGKAASFLLKQAHNLIVYGDYQNAKTLIDQAKTFPVEFTPEIGNPDQLLALIENSQNTSFQSANANPTNNVSPKSEVARLMSQAQLAADKGEWSKANMFAQQAKQFQLPDSAFADGEMRPWQMELKVQRSLNLQQSTAQMKSDSGVIQTSFNGELNSKVVTADYNPDKDSTRNVQVSGETDMDNDGGQFNPIPSRGMQLYQSGLQAVDNGDSTRAMEYFEMAWKYQNEFDNGTRQAIQDQLAKLTRKAPKADELNFSDSAVASASATAPIKQQPGTIQLPKADDSTAQSIFRDLQSHVFKERAASERLLATNPREALERMTSAREKINSSDLDANSKRPLLTIIDRDIDEMQTYIEQNLSEIMNEEANQNSKDTVDRRRQRKIDTELQIQKLVDDFNRLEDEERFMEAQMVARQAQDLAPDDEVVVALSQRALFLSRAGMNANMNEEKEQGYWGVMHDTERSAIPFDPSVRPLQYNNTEEYLRNARSRGERIEKARYDSESERQIMNLLRNEKVQGDYRGTLSEAMEQLSRQAGVNIIFDRVALDAAQVPMDRPIDVPILNAITFRSALNTILGSVGLTFVVEDEVIKVTTPEAQRSDLKPKTYYVGDLVVPITNFDGGSLMNFMQPNQGFTGQPYGNQLAGNGVQQAGGAMANSMGGTQQASYTMGQQLPNNAFGGGNPMMGYGGGSNSAPQSGVPYGQYNTVGPNRLGGITLQDFDPLIELIQSTIDPDGWDSSNGDGTIQPYVSNLSLVVSQTQEVQDQIQDLLKKLRELNDVQIVIEVRFITLSDNFFERVGIDFDFRINDNSNLAGLVDVAPQSTVIGLDPEVTPGLPNPTGDLDIPFSQNSFGSSAPLFGGFDVNTAANFGFAILSDIEVFFLMQAAKGDQRSNVMQAPTLTMFNGQSANIFDGAQVPFVTSVTPVVGDFAVAHQPVITILPEGTSLNVQAVVSADRRFVRMTLVPYFSQIRDVRTFQFAGSRTTRSSSDSFFSDFLDTINGTDDADDPDNQDLETAVEGVTIQLPTLSQTTISTVVSVPDGGTVLMGGIKRMSEGRSERGVPFLSNIPYVSRLFKNVGIGRETSNLMMTVTPRIIIQDEEEEIQVGPIGGN